MLTPSDYAGVVIVTEAPVPGTTPPATNPIVLPPAPIDSGSVPRYQNHTPTAAQIEAGMTKNSQDEPNIGVNWSSGAVMLQALMQTLRVQFDDQACPQTPPTSGAPTTGPQSTTSAISGLAALGSMVQSVNASAGTQSISVVASGDGLLRVVLIDPVGLTLATADAVNGVAVLDTTVSRTGVYQVKVVNVGTNLTQTWVAATPYGSR